jgi:4-hydroxythreonine-4-phosphate dehydrogenase
VKKISLAITLGDPAGIGPEIVSSSLKLWLGTVQDVLVKVIGPSNVLESIQHHVSSENIEWVAQTPFHGAVGKPSVESGESALRALYTGIDACRKGDVQGIVTAPISKEALALAGSKDTGHTSILERYLGVGPVAMAFVSPTLCVALATVHIPFKEVPLALTRKRIVEVGGLLDECLRVHQGLQAPRIAVAGLNPHAGEAGVLGDEEEKTIKPAVEILRVAEIDAYGPVVPDVVFKKAHEGFYDGVVAMYHDQALIPVKLLHFEKAVNVTLGLSAVRTSPDHGTAFDIAGQGRADPSSMLEALKTAYAWCLCKRG